MRLIIRYPDGRRSEALLLLESRDFLRVTMPGFDDVVDLRYAGGHWVDESGQPVSIEAMLALPTVAPARCAAAAGSPIS